MSAQEVNPVSMFVLSLVIVPLGIYAFHENQAIGLFALSVSAIGLMISVRCLFMNKSKEG